MRRVSGESSDLISEQQVYGQLLEVAGGAFPDAPLFRMLSESNGRRGRSFFAGYTRHPQLFPGLNQLIGAIDKATLLDLGEDQVSRLLVRAREDIAIAVDSMLSGFGFQVADASRDLMEIEYLLLEFAHDSERVGTWTTLSESKRAQQFGFSALRKKHEKRLGIAQGDASPEKWEYIAHCASLHPTPVGRGFRSDDFSVEYLIFHSSFEILEHGRRVLAALCVYIEMTNPELLDQVSIWDDLDIAEGAWQFCKEWYESIIGSVEGFPAREPRPEKEIPNIRTRDR